MDEQSMINLREALQEKIDRYNQENWHKVFELEKKDYNKLFKKAVTAFRDRINKDRTDDKIEYMAVYEKIKHLDIEVLRWFYGNCEKYSRKKGNTFSKCFFGSLK